MTPTFTFGLVADPQYGDKDDTFIEERYQRYREVPGKLKSAVDAFRAHGDRLAFVLTLGDTIDGRQTQEESTEDLETLAKILDTLEPTPVYSVVGNHDLSVPRQQFVTRLKMPGSYFSISLAAGWRLLVIDTTDLSTGSQYPQDSPHAIEARQFVEAHPDSPNLAEWNGGLASEQLRWLEEQLAAAEAAAERVIVASHHPIGAGSCRLTHQAWNWLEVQRRLTASRCVVLCLAGHDHPGGYASIHHVHFVTVEAMLEAPEGSNAYALVDVFNDHIHIKGVGSVTTRKLVLPDRLVQLT